MPFASFCSIFPFTLFHTDTYRDAHKDVGKDVLFIHPLILIIILVGYSGKTKRTNCLTPSLLPSWFSIFSIKWKKLTDRLIANKNNQTAADPANRRQSNNLTDAGSWRLVTATNGGRSHRRRCWLAETNTVELFDASLDFNVTFLSVTCRCKEKRPQDPKEQSCEKKTSRKWQLRVAIQPTRPSGENTKPRQVTHRKKQLWMDHSRNKTQTYKKNNNT